MLVAADARQTVLEHLPRGAVGMEIGVWRGDFAVRLLRVAQPALLHLVDPWQVADSQAARQAWYGSSRVTQLQMDETFDFVSKRFADDSAKGRVIIHRAKSFEVLSKLPEGSLDFIYVDGDHTFEGALGDFTNGFRAVKSGGLLCGDDYSLTGWWRDGVVRALHQFLATHPVVLEFVIGSQFSIRKLAAL